LPALQIVQLIEHEILKSPAATTQAFQIQKVKNGSLTCLQLDRFAAECDGEF